MINNILWVTFCIGKLYSAVIGGRDDSLDSDSDMLLDDDSADSDELEVDEFHLAYIDP